MWAETVAVDTIICQNFSF